MKYNEELKDTNMELVLPGSSGSLYSFKNVKFSSHCQFRNVSQQWFYFPTEPRRTW